MCTAASADQITLAQKCEKIARQSTLNTTELTTPTIRTSVGEVQFDKVEFAFPGIGPGGCLNSLDLTIQGAGTCQLELKAELSNGKLMLTQISGDLGKCAGFTGTGMTLGGYVYGMPMTPLEMTFNGVSCDANLVFEAYCVSGAYDFHLAGAVSSSVGSPTFDDQHFIVSGVLCSPQAPMGMCPSG